MSYAIYIGSDHSRDGHAWLAGYGDEPSSHWLDIVPRSTHEEGAEITVGVTADADIPGRLSTIPQARETCRHICVNYSYYKGAPAPLVNGGLNEYGVAVRDVWSPSRPELTAMTPPEQTGPNYSEQARIALARARTAREGIDIIADLIRTHGEATYGGNSHLIADADEAWVMIQFSGGKGLWAAERLGPSSIRASRPGYITIVPVDRPGHPDFLYSDNFVDFAVQQGWYEAGTPFDANRIYGDGKGPWDGVQWIEAEMADRAARPEKIGFEDMVFAVRSPRLTGDTAGYGQVVPLNTPGNAMLRMLWHAPIGPVAAPFAPVFIGQSKVPDEFRKHRYLTTGEDRTFMDNRKTDDDGPSQLSTVSQTVECSRSAVAACKRLLYLMVQAPDRFAGEVLPVFEAREAKLADAVAQALAMAEILIGQGKEDLAETLLTYFSCTELMEGLALVEALSAGIEARLRYTERPARTSTAFRAFEQIW
ncbi:dipeptidase [Hwanghaeella grinnelliae]|uniref:Dipeptidase n=1 Tax=Hwanghaeella grinnelliae TaxID=2500179 RepID=A0A437QWQ1_9PROT|nr:C69 family dipeptidase [Hwanghaeella grinnelliae]RVU38873.1 dipeptidase [Hwanghaeella grinnelliae]